MPRRTCRSNLNQVQHLSLRWRSSRGARCERSLPLSLLLPLSLSLSRSLLPPRSSRPLEALRIDTTWLRDHAPRSPELRTAAETWAGNYIAVHSALPPRVQSLRSAAAPSAKWRVGTPTSAGSDLHQFTHRAATHLGSTACCSGAAVLGHT